MRYLPALVVVAAFVLAACEPIEDSNAVAGGDSLDQEFSEEQEALPLWTEEEGERSVLCSREDGFVQAGFTLPASSPITDELNSVFHQYDGRAPMTVLPVTQIWRASYPDIDETDYLSALHLETPDGEISLKVNDGNDDAAMMLYDTRLALSRPNENQPQELIDQAKSVRDTMNEYIEPWEDEKGRRYDVMVYFVTEQPLTHIISAHASLGGRGGECVLE